jgi:hypothetical protein
MSSWRDYGGVYTLLTYSKNLIELLHDLVSWPVSLHLPACFIVKLPGSARFYILDILVLCMFVSSFWPC